jgi:ferredoxin
MIFYFSGTGNSYYAAKLIGDHTGEELVNISASELESHTIHKFSLKAGERIGFVHPTYAWGPPKPVLSFIEKLQLQNYHGNYVFSVVTCGGNAGNSFKVIKNALEKKDIGLSSGYAVVMPNNFILMGDVDSKEKEAHKLAQADQALKEISESIKLRATDFKASWSLFSWFLTGVMNPMFNKKALDTSKFHSGEQCTRCGTCEAVCNCSNIKVVQKPQWGQHCTQCLACIHYCPAQAIQYSKATAGKGRYANPNVSVKEMIKSR